MDHASFDDGIRQLWASVISQAICEIDLRSDKALRAEAVRWINSNSTHERSFVWICQMLDLDHQRIRMMCLTRQGRKQLTGRLFSRRPLEGKEKNAFDD